MGRGLQQQDRRVDVAAATPAMQALIEASTAASEAQSVEVSSTLANDEEGAGNSISPSTKDGETETNPESGNHVEMLPPIHEDHLANLDPNDHARVNDPIVRPAKKNKKVFVYGKGNANRSKTSENDTSNNDEDSHSFDRSNAPEHNDSAVATKPQSIGFSESILSRLFEPDRKQKPKLWEFIRLVAPGPANEPPMGQYKWRSKDAVAAYCLKCKIAFTYTPGTSKTISRHLIAYHGFQTGSGNVPGSSAPPTTQGAAGGRRKQAKAKGSPKVAVAKKGAPKTKTHAIGAGNSRSSTATTLDSLSTRKRRRPSSIPAAAETNENGVPTATLEEGDERRILRSASEEDDDDESMSDDSPLSPLKKHKVARSALLEQTFKKKPKAKMHSGGLLPRKNAFKHRGKQVMEILSTDDEDADEDEDGEDAFINGHGRNRKEVIAKALFRFWVGTHQSLDCYDTRATARRSAFGGRNNASSLFVDFCKTLDDSFELPEPSVMESLANTAYERLQTEIKIHVSKLFPRDDATNSSFNNNDRNNIGSHEFVSASVRRVKVVRFVDPGRRADTVIEGDVDDGYESVDEEGKNRFFLVNGGGEGMGTKIRDKTLGEGQQLEIEEKTFYPIRLTFCTPLFRMKSYVIAVIPEESQCDKSGGDNGQIENGKNDEEAILSPYSKSMARASKMYGFPRDNISRIVIRGSCQEVDEGISASITSGESFCILDRLDATVARALRSPTLLPRWMKKLLSQSPFPREEERKELAQISASSIFCTLRAHEMLLASLPESEEADSEKYNAIADIIDTITPFRDAIITLSEDPYSTIGLVIPVLRRVRNVLIRQRTKLLEKPEKFTTASLSEVGDFHPSILTDFEKTFASVLKNSPTLMWTVPLDPRLIAMRGLSGVEQKNAKSELIKEVAKIVQIIDEREQSKKDKIARNVTEGFSSKSNRTRYSSASTMGGIFWGDDDSDPTTSGEIDSNQPSSSVRDAKQYATKNVNSYFNTVHSQRVIKDPMLWWKNNQDQFPELAMLARKWMSASAVYGRKHTRANESASVIQTSYSDTESICRMIFLHDNNDLI